MKEEFTALVRKSGEAVIVTIPAFLVKNERVVPGKEYRITIEE